MSMYNCAVCDEKRCEHVIEEMDDMRDRIATLESKLSQFIDRREQVRKLEAALLKADEGLKFYLPNTLKTGNWCHHFNKGPDEDTIEDWDLIETEDIAWLSGGKKAMETRAEIKQLCDEIRGRDE